MMVVAETHEVQRVAVQAMSSTAGHLVCSSPIVCIMLKRGEDAIIVKAQSSAKHNDDTPRPLKKERVIREDDLTIT